MVAYQHEETLCAIFVTANLRFIPTKPQVLKKHKNQWWTAGNLTTANLPKHITAHNFFITSFKENSEIVVYREPYRVFLREITQRLRNNRLAPVTKLYGNFTESGKETKRILLRRCWGTERIKNPKDTVRSDKANKGKVRNFGKSSFRVYPRKHQMGWMTKAEELLGKSVWLCDRKEGDIRGEERRKTKGWRRKLPWVYWFSSEEHWSAPSSSDQRSTELSVSLQQYSQANICGAFSKVPSQLPTGTWIRNAILFISYQWIFFPIKLCSRFGIHEHF